MVSSMLVNFARINSAVRISPAKAMRLETRLWDLGNIVKLVENREAGQDPNGAELP
jgi:hypothetical protein